MLVQVDGSVHAWLEERGPRCTLLLAIDDATSTVPYALFRHEEDTHGYFLLMQELIRRCGVPLALYSDRHAVFKYVPGSHQSPAPTPFGRAMAELGVEQIFARSPEAKGRVERANGTFQDRLVTELRLAGARTISEANQVLWAFLTRFNKRFGVPPAQSTNAYRSPDPDLNLAGILCFKHASDVAETTCTPFQAEADAAPVRLIVRRVKPTPGSQLALFAKYSYHGFITDRDGELLELEADHRRHAEIENAIRDLKYGVGLNHLPSGRFAANGAWLAVQTMAHNLARWTARIGLGERIATTKTLRRRFFSLAGRLTRSARRLTLHLPDRWGGDPTPNPAEQLEHHFTMLKSIWGKVEKWVRTSPRQRQG